MPILGLINNINIELTIPWIVKRDEEIREFHLQATLKYIGTRYTLFHLIFTDGFSLDFYDQTADMEFVLSSGSACNIDAELLTINGALAYIHTILVNDICKFRYFWL